MTKKVDCCLLNTRLGLPSLDGAVISFEEDMKESDTAFPGINNSAPESAPLGVDEAVEELILEIVSDENTSVNQAVELMSGIPEWEKDLFRSSSQMLYRRLDFCRRKSISLPLKMVRSCYGGQVEMISKLTQEQKLELIREIDEIIFG